MAIVLNAKGTSQTEFRLGKKGPILKQSSGTFELRNSTDSSYAEILAQGSTPSSDNSLVSKQYVDSIATGLNVKDSCRVGTTASSDLSGYTYVPGNESTGNVWTGVTSAPTIDGVTMSDGERILIKDASDQRGNGLFTYNDTNDSFVRTADADNSPSNEVAGGMFCLITEGTTNGSTGWTLTSPSGIAALGTDNLVFTQFSNVGGGLVNIVEDTTPQLGGDLDVNGFSIISASAGDIAITPDTTGKIILDGLNWPTADGSTDQFLKTNGSGQLSFETISQATGNELENIVEDTTPQLGGDLDVNGQTIVSVSNGDISLVPNGTGLVVADSGYDMSSGPGHAFATKAYVGTIQTLPGGTDTQMQYNNNGAFAGDSGFTTDGAGNVDITGSLDVDNLKLDGNTVSTTDTNGDLYLTPDGTGEVYVGAGSGSTSTITAEGTGTNVDLQLLGKGTGLVIAESGYDMSSGPDYAFATKNYVQSQVSVETPGGTNTQIQYNNSGAFGGDSGFTTNGSGSVDITGDLDVDSINLNGATISVDDNTTNTDLVLQPKGTGLVVTVSGYDMSTGPAYALATKAYVDANAGGGGSGEDLIGAANSTTIVDGIEVSAAVNYLEITNAGATAAPKIATAGTDTNIDLEFETQGTGEITFISGPDADIVISAEDATAASNEDGSNMTLRAGDGDGTGNGGDIVLDPGSGGTTGDVGRVLVGSAAIDVIIQSEDATGTNDDGKKITLQGGTGNGMGDGGNIVLSPGNGGASGEKGQVVLDGGVTRNRRTTTGGNTQEDDYYIFANTASGTVTVTLRTVDTIDGRELIIKDSAGNANTNNITINTEGSENIDGASSQTISTNYGSLTLVADGSNWFII